MILVRQTNQHMLFTGKHRYINTKFVKGNSRGRGYNCLTEESIVVIGSLRVQNHNSQENCNINPFMPSGLFYISLRTGSLSF